MEKPDYIERRYFPGGAISGFKRQNGATVCTYRSAAAVPLLYVLLFIDDKDRRCLTTETLVQTLTTQAVYLPLAGTHPRANPQKGRGSVKASAARQKGAEWL